MYFVFARLTLIEVKICLFIWFKSFLTETEMFFFQIFRMLRITRLYKLFNHKTLLLLNVVHPDLSESNEEVFSFLNYLEVA